MDLSVEKRFSFRWGFILSALGITIGTCNIRRFPRIVAQNGNDQGAGAFLLVWIAFLFLWRIPYISIVPNCVMQLTVIITTFLIFNK